MIDPHVHLRDWEQKHKETVEHGLDIAYRVGLYAVFEMPNTNPALTSIKTIEDRIELADKAIKNLRIPIFHGLYAGITSNPKQIEEVVNSYDNLFPRVVGLKMFAGHSTGNMGIIEERDQELVYQTLKKLGFKGVLAVHCEKESLMKPKLWDYRNPFSHTLARPPKSEVESVKDQIKLASKAKYEGTLHVCHISVPESLNEIEKARGDAGFRISCGITPHHALIYDTMMNNKNGLLLKMNPPLRTKEMQRDMLDSLFYGRITWIETDHAPIQLMKKSILS